MVTQADIHKAGGLIIRDRKVLASRSKGSTIFVQPGGKLEEGEAAEDALIRELREEQGVIITKQDITFFGTYSAVAAGHESSGLMVRIDTYLVHAYQGELTPQAEIEENLWVDSVTSGVKLGSILEHDIVPKLKNLNLIS